VQGRKRRLRLRCGNGQLITEQVSKAERKGVPLFDILLTAFLPLFRTDLTHFLLVFGTVFARFSLFAVAHTCEHGVGIDINVLRRDYGKVQVRRVAVSGVANVAYKLALLHAVAFA